MTKLVTAIVVLAILGGGIWLGMQSLRGHFDESATRPFRAPNKLVIAAVMRDYASSATDDGSVILQKTPRGAAAALAGFYAIDTTRVTDAVDQAVAAIPGATYRAQAAPSGKCRSDAETSISTLGEISIGQQRITLFTCVLTKKRHMYFLAWAAAEGDDDRRRLESMLKSSQLVSNDLCAVNVINAGCTPSASSLVGALVAGARR